MLLAAQKLSMLVTEAMKDAHTKSVDVRPLVFQSVLLQNFTSDNSPGQCCTSRALVCLFAYA